MFYFSFAQTPVRGRAAGRPTGGRVELVKKRREVDVSSVGWNAPYAHPLQSPSFATVFFVRRLLETLSRLSRLPLFPAFRSAL
jgi:hypothetical protein